MSRLDGGIFSKPRGTTAGIVFGSARTRQGKVVTSRQYVIPSNPNTPDQQAQRTSFSDIQQVLKQLGPSCYQIDWNRAVGQLAGYNSLQSILLYQINTSQDIVLSTIVNLGSLHFPSVVTPSSGAPGNLTVGWTTELGPDGDGDDIVKVIAIASAHADRQIAGSVVFDVSAVRSESSVTLSDLPTATYEIYLYLIGDAVTNLGLPSLAKPYSQAVA
jgi:hypothetical protein